MENAPGLSNAIECKAARAVYAKSADSSHNNGAARESNETDCAKPTTLTIARGPPSMNLPRARRQDGCTRPPTKSPRSTASQRTSCSPTPSITGSYPPPPVQPTKPHHLRTPRIGRQTGRSGNRRGPPVP